MGDQLRKLSFECFTACKDPLAKEKSKVDGSLFTLEEMTCVEKCENRVERLKEVIERHVNDTFSP